MPPWAPCRFVDNLVYYGLSFQVGEFGLDIYLTQLIFGAVEVPACLFSIFMMERLGRKWSQSGTLIVGGVMCIATAFIPSGTGWLYTMHTHPAQPASRAMVIALMCN